MNRVTRVRFTCLPVRRGAITLPVRMTTSLGGLRNKVEAHCFFYSLALTTRHSWCGLERGRFRPYVPRVPGCIWAARAL